MTLDHPDPPAPPLPFSELARLLLAVFIVTFPNFLYFCIESQREHPSAGPVVYGWVLGILPLLTRPSIIRKTLLIYLGASVFIPLIILYMILLQVRVDKWTFMILLETNGQEASAYAWQLIVGVVAGLVCGILYHRYFVKTRHTVCASKMPLIKWARCLLWFPIFALILKDYHAGGMEAIENNNLSRIGSCYPFGVLVAYVQSLGLRSQIASRDVEAILVKSSARHIAATPQQREIYILVLGESARFASFQLNGYERATTPKLAAIPRLINFQDVITEATLTGQSVPLLITPAPITKLSQAQKYPSIITLSRRAGFRTYWLSTQPKQGSTDTVCSTYAKDANESLFLSPPRTDEAYINTAYDGELLAPLKEILKRNELKVIIVLHTMGSHWSYPARYPSEFQHFPTVLKPKFLSPQPASAAKFPVEFTNAYDNTILYTDWFLNEVIHELDRIDAVTAFWYVSDHGENSATAPKNPCMHGVVSPDVLHVPMLVWLSPGYARARPIIAKSLALHRNAPLSTSTVFHSFLQTAGITSDSVTARMGIASEEFRPSSRQVLPFGGAILDYDKNLVPLNSSKPSDSSR